LRIVKVAIALLDHLHVAAQREVHCVDITQLLSGLGAAFYVVERGKEEERGSGEGRYSMYGEPSSWAR